MTGQDYYQIEQLGQERFASFQKDAAAYRAVEYHTYHSASRALFAALGDLLLNWGRRLRERDGEVLVQILTVPRKGCRDCDAAA